MLIMSEWKYLNVVRFHRMMGGKSSGEGINKRTEMICLGWAEIQWGAVDHGSLVAFQRSLFYFRNLG